MNLQISGKTSAGWASSIMTNLGGICLDMGISEQFNHGAKTICLTHQHCDHVHGLDLHIMRLIESGYEGMVTVYCSPGNSNRIQDRLNLLSRKNRDQVELICISPGQNIDDVNSGFRITAFKTDHTDPDSQGYVVSQSREKLLASLHGTPGETIAYLRKKGIKVTETVVVPLVTYTGDTRATIWSKYNYEMDLARKAEVLITEATYFFPDTIEESVYRGHTHYSQLVQKDLGRNQLNKLILCHISRKYAGLDWRSPEGYHLSDFAKMSGAQFIYPNDSVHHF